jgi:hypothetical protein
MDAGAGPTPPMLLVVGCEGAGKSLLVRALRVAVCTGLDGAAAAEPYQLVPVTVQTSGAEPTDMLLTTADATTMPWRVLEVGGSFVGLWPSYFAACRAVLVRRRSLSLGPSSLTSFL